MANQGVEGAERVEQSPADRGRRTRSRWRWVVWGLVVLIIAGGIVALAIHWQERTLRNAQRELREGDPWRTLALVSYFLDAHPEHGGALALKARALCLTGQTKAAIKLYEKVGAATAEDVHAWRARVPAAAVLVPHLAAARAGSERGARQCRRPARDHGLPHSAGTVAGGFRECLAVVPTARPGGKGFGLAGGDSP